ncbi:MAG: glycoside hydrolase family 31 protein [Deltaproteobacteria bacterium]|nr:glycoside hydrolase family 31 protein [Deltaproteobacteria bacterium]
MRFSSFVLIGLVFSVAMSACTSGSSGDPEPEWTIDAGALKLRVTESPWNMAFFDAEGNPVLIELPDMGDGPSGSLGMHLGPPPPGSGQNPRLPLLEDGEPATPPSRDSGWVHATAVESSRYEGESFVATIATSDPARKLELVATAEADGVIQINVQAANVDGVQALGIGFVAEPEERYVGFGERSNVVNQASWAIEHYTTDGPYYNGAEYGIMRTILPPAGTRWRDDTTYFPIPWLLSSRGYGVLIDNDQMSYHRLGSDSPDAWSMEVEASQLQFRVFGGPTPIEALGRYTEELGRQPDNYAPWFFGTWLQTDNDDRIVEARADDVPTSLNATYTHYLPCGSQQGNEEAQRVRTAANHDMGVAIHTYFNPMVCVTYEPVFSDAIEQGALMKDGDGEPYIYDYCSSLSNCFEVSQFDFTTDSGQSMYKGLLDEAIEHGYDGWMEDFGEYTALDAVAASGVTGTEYHNAYVRDYHCGAYEATRGAGKPLARFVRSGWTGSPACSPIVWGGDPTTAWDYDGLESSIYRALSIGTSGVGIWGSDIGGFHAMRLPTEGPPRFLTDEMFDRWIAFGGLSVVMRSERSGVQVPTYDRPQPWDEDHQPIWRMYSKLHTQLYPYLQAAAEDYYATGRPVMQHHVLTHPGDAEATGRDDQYMFGPHILVAPVYIESATDRELYLPEGTWVEWWRTVAYGEEGGTFSLGAAVLHDGMQSVSVGAPLTEIPMFVEAGGVIPMLSPDVFTLAEYGDDPEIIHASDRDHLLHVLAFPRGETAGKFYDDGTWTSVEGDGTWTHLEATTRTLTQPFDVCGVNLDGTPLPEEDWSYDAATGVLDATYTTTSGTLATTGC